MSWMGLKTGGLDLQGQIGIQTSKIFVQTVKN